MIGNTARHTQGLVSPEATITYAKDAGDRLFHRISPDYSHFTFSLKKERFQQSKNNKTQGKIISSFHTGTGNSDNNKKGLTPDSQPRSTRHS